MKLIDVVVLTDARFVNPTEINDSNRTVLLEDDLVLKALEKQGLKTIKLSWDDPNFDWSTTKYALFRSTWDYFYRFDEFSIWLNKASQQTQFLNVESIIRWNIDKHYLQDLINKGIHCPPTEFIEIGEKITLADLYAKHHFNETVLKPAVSGTARHTYRLNPNNLAEHESIFKELILQETMLIQPFQHNIIEKGEISLVVIDGKFTHAVLKVAKVGDFRVQDNFGGTAHEYNPSGDEITFAEKAVNACHPKPIYARVDIFTDNGNQIALAELELIEPELWFRNNPNAADDLAKAIKKLL